MSLERATPLDVAAIAWTERTNRAEDLARVLGGTGRRFGNFGLRGSGTAPLRWILNAIRTAWWLGWHRPGVVIVQTPPFPPAVLAMVYARAARAALLLDSHPTSFGLKDARPWIAAVPVTRWIVPRAAGVLVTTHDLVDQVRAWGGRGLIVHEPPSTNTIPRKPRRTGGYGLVVFTFSPDEPVAAVLDAARQHPDIALRITGDISKARPEVIDRIPSNVRLVGFLAGDEYQRAIEESAFVVALTTEPASVQRAAYEAVYAQRPLIVSDSPMLGELFPHAITVKNDSESIAWGLGTVRDRQNELADLAPRARRWAEERWQQQLSALRACVEQALGD